MGRRAAGPAPGETRQDAERRKGPLRERPGGAERHTASRRSAFPGLNPELAAYGGDGGSRPEERPRASSRPGHAAGIPGPGRLGGRPAAMKASGTGRAAGIIAFAVAVVSLFVWSLPLGLTASALGLYVMREGARGLGAGAVILGLAAAAAQLVLIPIRAAW
ncbi:MAG: hypothetical protein A9Z00_06205 [Thermobacillus sp. ZCTH02-B1]|uniref:hypothetical protein n=1 Tax=Thermobacillus sp. ZCTH02-B1 TaxID=1858795 RepID=UPI000B55E67F|nr:hypothetical protein [Thermobacillus sp. ZCTH02-B1]OUM95955.1 MAG: hypothetical protein A9Z00_06205 [Thermobacillus sp. ZCTH02-B1]